MSFKPSLERVQFSGEQVPILWKAAIFTSRLLVSGHDKGLATEMLTCQEILRLPIRWDLIQMGHRSLLRSVRQLRTLQV
jgi:hypothetical protein